MLGGELHSSVLQKQTSDRTRLISLIRQLFLAWLEHPRTTLSGSIEVAVKHDSANDGHLWMMLAPSRLFWTKQFKVEPIDR